MSKKEKSQEIIFGIHPIVELLKAKKRKLFTIYTTKPTPKSWDQIQPLIPPFTQIQYVNREALNKLAGTTDHQGVVAFAGPLPIRKKFFDPSKDKFLVMLDSIQDPRNLGAILRSAYCTGANGVIITQKDSAPLTGVALKSSAGLAEHLEIYYAPSSKAAAIELQKAGYNIYLATLSKKSKNALDVEYNLPVCIVIGSEGTGVSKEIFEYGQHIILPQKTSDISYNASVAAGILLFTVATRNNMI